MSSKPKPVIVVNVPMKITVLQGEEILLKYEEVLSLNFDTQTATGRGFAKRMTTLVLRDGRLAQDALYAIACDEVLTHPEEVLQKLAAADFGERSVGQKVRLRVTQSGDIYS